ncbi:MAG: DUF3347 domain-containing protein [Bacteroidota bacterium]|nr:DUF3347 domain-containing protein [Bacteroidota bacterium]
MKTTMIMLFLALVSWGASAQHDHSSMGNSSSSHSNMAPKMKEEPRVIPSIKVKHSLSVTSVLDNYLALKDALVDDNGKKAASSGKMLFDALGKFDLSSQEASKQKELKEILDDAKENAEHISENGDKIDHQREHFEVLGGDLKDLIVITGSDRTLYQLFCPMYNKNKGGKWLSASDKIKNPFFGKKMEKCGRVLVEISVK